MRRDANFGIGDAVIQVKEERETDKSGYFGIYIAEIQKKLERETDINFVRWMHSPGGLNPCARVFPRRKQPVDYHAT